MNQEERRAFERALARWPRSVAFAVHLAISATVALVVAAVTLALWYPGAYGELSGGRHLFWLIVSVDVVMGPLLTAIVFNLAKPRRELVRDLAIIAVLQTGALSYGLWTLFEARPVALVFETDRFRVVSAADVLAQELHTAAPAFRRLPLMGPWTLGTRSANSANEKLEAIELALNGFDIGQRPSFWQPYAASRAEALRRSRPVAELIKHYAAERVDIESRVQRLGLDVAQARFLPVQARATNWLVLLRPDGDVAGFAPYDGIF